MSNFIDAVSSQAFMQNAIFGGILASVACGVVGSYVVVKRIGYLAGGIAHSVMGGMGIAYYLDRPPIEGALVAALVFAVYSHFGHLNTTFVSTGICIFLNPQNDSSWV